MSLEEEMEALPDIAPIGIALSRYALSLFPDARFVRLRNGRWVCDPDFVGFQVHSSRTASITVTVRGSTLELKKQPGLRISKGRSPSYSEFRVKSPGHLAAAAWYIASAAMLFKRGRSRLSEHGVVPEL